MGGGGGHRGCGNKPMTHEARHCGRPSATQEPPPPPPPSHASAIGPVRRAHLRTTAPGHHGGFHGRIPVWVPISMLNAVLFPGM